MTLRSVEASGARKLGLLRIQVRGPKKWAQLRRPGTSFPWGRGYEDTYAQAMEKAKKVLAEIQAADPYRDYRVS